MLLRLRRELYGKRGLIILDSALIFETNMAYLCNNNVVLVQTSSEIQLERLKERGYSELQIQVRVSSQFSYGKKKMSLENQILEKRHGRLFYFDNSGINFNQSLRELTELIVQHFKVPVHVSN